MAWTIAGRSVSPSFLGKDGVKTAYASPSGSFQNALPGIGQRDRPALPPEPHHVGVSRRN
jgi:hypothetical protein